MLNALIGPASVFAASGMQPDSWQLELLTTDARQVLALCGRQTGKTTAAIALALNTALCAPNSLVLLASPKRRQCLDNFDRVRAAYNLLRPPRVSNRKHRRLDLDNGSCVLCLPTSACAAFAVGFSSVSLIIFDDAVFIADLVYHLLRPLVALSSSRLVALSTLSSKKGKPGWFLDQWVRCEKRKRMGEEPLWKQIKVPSEECPRIAKEFLAEEKSSIGESLYRQEYGCELLTPIE